MPGIPQGFKKPSKVELVKNIREKAFNGGVFFFRQILTKK